VGLRVVDVPGGRVAAVVPGERRYRRPPGTLRIAAVDAAGAPLPVRISVTGADGRGWTPDDAWRHADDGFDRKLRPFEMTYFHSRGAAVLTLPPGEYRILATHGLEYGAVAAKATVAANASADARLVLTRIDDLTARGWWSGDLHVHMNYGGHYRNDPARLRAQAEAEDLHVVEDLIVNKEQRVPDVALFSGALDPVSTATTLVKHDQEYHTSWWGHTGHLGLKELLMLPDYAGYAETAAASLFPDNAWIADLAHAQGGISGYVHPFDPPVPDPAGADPLTNGLPIDVALGKVDYVEVVGFSDHRTTAEVWYRLLDCGFRLPTGAGTDAMANYASLRGPVGMNRVFARAGSALDYRLFLAAVKAGRTFATNGPVFGFAIEGREAGDEITLPEGGRDLAARVRMRSIVPIEKLEIVGSGGKVVAAVPLEKGGTSADASVSLAARESGWYVLRAWSASAAEPVLDIYPYATTSPIYVTVAGRPVRRAAAARYFEAWIDRVRGAAAAHGGWNDEREKAEVMDRLDRARAEFVRREAEAR